MKFNPKKYGLYYNRLYEVLATTLTYDRSESGIIPNTSSMGIRLTEQNHFTLNPYPTTHTFKNLKQYNIITLNLIEDVYLYALASLKDRGLSTKLRKFPSDYYKYINVSKNKELRFIIDQFPTIGEYKIPYVKDAWGILICKVVNERKKVKHSQLGEIKLTEFELEVLLEEKYQDSFKLFNRAENIALEMIILATRLKVAYENEDKSLFSKIYDQILDYKTKLTRFSNNTSANKTLEIIDTYIKNYRD